METYQREAAIDTYRTFFDLGSMLSPIIMTLVLESRGIAACFYLASALLFVNLILTWMLEKAENWLP